MSQADLKLFGQGLIGPLAPAAKSTLHHEFGVPPFSTLNARDGAWQNRKRAWLRLGIQGEIGRPDNLLGFSEAAQANLGGTSIFDPVLCEVAYNWWCPPEGVILDPFAGGSVRGIVASVLGRRYFGVELRAEQVAANQAQWQSGLGRFKPKWVCGDSSRTLHKAPLADFLFTCPPYGNLERYSDDPADLSTMDYDKFLESYAMVIRGAVARLRDNRFACFVVGSFRNKATGFINDLAADTTAAFLRAGLRLYNDAIIETAVTSASMRARRIFSGARKLTKVHQNVLVYVKGDPKAAATRCNLPTC